MASKRRVVVFDMDGTLTRSYLDFDRMREEIGVLAREPILEAMEKMPPPERARAIAILKRYETEAAANSELQPGAAEVIAAVRTNGMPVVLMTRNTRKSVEVLQARHGIAFDMVLTREDGAIKPSPEPIFRICRALEAEPSRAWTIGDYHYDIICGAAAGATTVLLLDTKAERPVWADQADHVISELRELLPLLGI